MADKAYLQKAAEAVHAALPDHHGFILLAVPYEGGDGRLKYVSNIDRESAINLLKEFLISCSGEEEWMKHIK